MSISSNTALTLTPGQGRIETDALTPGVGGDVQSVKVKTRGCNHDSSNARPKADNFKPPPLKRQTAFRETKTVGLKRPRALTADGTPYGLMAQQSPIRSTQTEAAARIGWRSQVAPEAPEALKRRKLRPVVTHDSPVPSGGFDMFDPHDEGEAAAREQALHDQAVRDQAAEDQAALVRAIARRNAHELREQSARERAARDYESPSEEGSCQPPKRPVKYGGFATEPAQRSFRNRVQGMSRNARDGLFTALVNAESKAESHLYDSIVAIRQHEELFGYQLDLLSGEQGQIRDVLEDARATAEQSLMAIQAKIGVMST